MQTARQTKRLCGKMPPSARKNHYVRHPGDTSTSVANTTETRAPPPVNARAPPPPPLTTTCTRTRHVKRRIVHARTGTRPVYDDVVVVGRDGDGMRWRPKVARRTGRGGEGSVTCSVFETARDEFFFFRFSSAV